VEAVWPNGEVWGGGVVGGAGNLPVFVGCAGRAKGRALLAFEIWGTLRVQIPESGTPKHIKERNHIGGRSAPA